MRTFTLDWNCVIALENKEPAASGVAGLADAHRENRADVALLATSASENLRDGTFPGSFSLFEERVRSVGLADLPVLNTPAVWSLTFWGRSYWVDIENYRRQKAAFWKVLFPNIEEEPWHRLGSANFNANAQSSKLKRWRNAWCDVHNLVTHIDHQRDVFVTTNTRDYQRNTAQLKALGVENIVTPSEAVALIETDGIPD